jgi:adenine phosphoribosyltransferase
MFMDYKKYIADVKDFPIEGILFRDVTPLIQDGEAFDSVCNDFAEFAKEVDADIIVGPEARGFIFGCPVACKLKKGFVPIRKPNKLPRETVSMSYDLEYGSNVLSIHKDSIKPGQRVLIVDDLLATGGTTVTAAKLIESLGGVVAGFAFLVELTDLKGRDLIKDYKVLSLIKY